MSTLLKPHRRRWVIALIIFLATVFNYFDRQILAVLKPVLENEFHMGNEGYALIVNVFTISYAIMYPVSGWLVDKFGAKKIMLLGVLTWAFASIGTGLARTVGQFAFFRGMLGVAEPSNFPVKLKVVTVWFPAKLRATANSFCEAGSSIGAILAPPLAAWIAITYNWHMVFMVGGGAGLLIALLWVIFYRNPPARVTLETTGLAEIKKEKSFSWSRLWTKKSLWGVLLIRFISDPVWYFCLFWLPGYLQEQSGLSLKQMGLFGWIPFLIADLGAIGMSAWSDRMVRKGVRPLRSRKIMLSTVALMAPLCALTPYFPSALVTLTIFSLVAITCLTWLFNINVVVAEAFPVGNVASVLGIAGGFGAAGAVLLNYFIGQYMGSLGIGKIFLCMAFLHPIAVLLLWVIIKPEKPVNPENRISVSQD